MQTLTENFTVTYHHGSYIRLTPDWKNKNVICPNSKIYYVTKGEVCVEVDDRIYTAHVGDAILIPAGIKHSYYLGEDMNAEKFWFHFDIRCAQTNYFDTVNFPYLKHIGSSDNLKELFSAVVEPRSNKPSDKIAVISAITSIVSIFLDGSDYSDNTESKNDETDKVITFIKKNYYEKFTLPYLSEMAKLSPNHFERKFKEKVGYPPLKYINVLRLERAKFLLEHTKKPINTIMEEVGFWDAAHFSKLFKLETGYAPSQFRKALALRNNKRES